MSVQLPDSARLLIEAELTPIQGTRFQPTGFPDLGAAMYELHNGTPMLIVESTQSVANRLEASAWDASTGHLRLELEGLSYVSVVDEHGKELTNSLLEAHRLNSVYIERSDKFGEISAEIGYTDGQPFDQRVLARAVAKYDINSLLHGVFLESIAGVLRIPRALSGFIEASGVTTVTSGGVKNDRVRSGTECSDAGAAEGYGNVPYHRDEYTAERITAYFNIDVAQIRGYGLGDTANALLFSLALWKIQTFLESGMRLRTACDFDVSQVRVTRPDGFSIPTCAQIEAELPALIFDASSQGLFAKPPITVARYAPAKGRAKPAKNKAKAEQETEASA